jgi:uracil-DNA glycosylase
MPLSFTPLLRLKRCHACDQCHSSWVFIPLLPVGTVNCVQILKANAHKDRGWETFTDAIISALNKNYSNIVFVLWGGYAQKKGKSIDKKKHCVLNGPHPSPLSAHRGFFGSKPFSKTNEYLASKGRDTIDWRSVMPGLGGGGAGRKCLD